MPILKQIIFASVLVLALLSTAAAQESTSATVQRSALTITAAAAGERVRITAPSAVVQMHVEVYAASGEKLFDQEIRGGNVFDWHLQDGQAQRLAPGSYVCVVTAKSISGKLTQKIGTVRVEEKSASVQPAEPLSAPQAQTIGRVEENSSWTIPGKDEPQTPTVIANDGTDGQMIRGRGALTFRIGNFFSGIDQEQMRLSEEGNLGIGTSEPKAKLDVAGTIRAERFLIAKPKPAGGDKTATDSKSLVADSGDSVQPLTSGTGTPNQIAKWIISDTLGDSGITETASGVGIGTTGPGAPLHVFGTTSGFTPLVRFSDNNSSLGAMQYFEWRSGAVNNKIHGIAADGNGLGFYRLNDAGNAFLSPSPDLVLSSNGNVGLGTTGPAAPFHVFRTTSGFTPIVRFSDNNSSLGAMQYFEWRGGAVNNKIHGIAADGNGLGFYRLNDAGTAFLSPTPDLVLSSSGNVGLGTTNPTAKFHVAGGDLLFENKWRTETTTVNSPAVPGPPNLIGGFLGTGSGGATPGNRVTAGVVGATIGGGGFNGLMISPSTFFFGDGSNRVTDWFGTVGGGYGNRAGNDDATLDDAVLATVSGGAQNTASRSYSTVGGGFGNTASGFYSTVPGGYSNGALGIYSFAAGRQARANYEGAFVWADSTAADFTSTGNNQFLIRASGGVGIGTNTPSSTLSVNGTADFSGGVGIGTTAPVGRLQVVTADDTNPSVIAAWDARHFVIGGAASSGGIGMSYDQTNNVGYITSLSPSVAFRNLALQSGGGKVGIGTASPDRTLTVNGEADKPSGGAWLVFSDERLKTIRGRFTPGLKALMQLQPVRYEYKPDNALGLRSSGEHIGFGAQAVRKIIPEAVTKNDRGYLLVNNDPIMWTMLNAIKEQQQQIAELRTANTALNARLRLIERTVKNKTSPTRQRR